MKLFEVFNFHAIEALIPPKLKDIIKDRLVELDDIGFSFDVTFRRSRIILIIYRHQKHFKIDDLIIDNLTALCDELKSHSFNLLDESYILYKGNTPVPIKGDPMEKIENLNQYLDHDINSIILRFKRKDKE
jgi:hypothetical protein